MVCDILYCNLTLLHMVPVVISSNIHVVPDMVSRIIVAVYMSFLLSSFHLIGLQAYERYSYFITPLKYPRKSTKRRIFTAVIIVFVLAFCFALGADLILPRIPVATIMTYQVTGLATKLTSISYSNQRDPCEASEKSPENGGSGVRIFLVDNNTWLLDKHLAFSFWCHLGIHRPKNISVALCSIQDKLHADHSHV